MLDRAGTIFTILVYNKSAIFPSRKIFRAIYAFSTPSNKIGNSFFVVLLCEVALQSSAISLQIINIEVEDSLREKSTRGGINYQFLKGANTESRGISPELIQICYINVNYNCQPNLCLRCRFRRQIQSNIVKVHCT